MELPTIALGIAAITVAWLLTFAMMKVAGDADEVDDGIAIGGREGRRLRARGSGRTDGSTPGRHAGFRSRRRMGLLRRPAMRRSLPGR